MQLFGYIAYDFVDVFWIFASFKSSVVDVLFGECVDIRHSHDEYNWLAAGIEKKILASLGALFGSV